jgi:hypothetical protein
MKGRKEGRKAERNEGMQLNRNKQCTGQDPELHKF